MRYTAAVVAVILLGVAGSEAVAQAPANLPKLAAPRWVASYPRPPAIPASLTDTTDVRAQIAACAHFAALRGMGARATGADYATQDRVLELAFLLCMSGKSVAN